MMQLSSILDNARLALEDRRSAPAFFDIQRFEKTVYLDPDTDTDGQGPWRPFGLNRQSKRTIATEWLHEKSNRQDLRICWNFVSYIDPITKRHCQGPLATRSVVYHSVTETLIPAGEKEENFKLIAYLTKFQSNAAEEYHSQSELGCTPVEPRFICIHAFEEERRSLASSLDRSRHPQILNSPALRDVLVPDLRSDSAIDDMPAVAENVSLDPAQRDAVACAMKQSIIVEGPPGTGKSQVITQITCSTIDNGQRVLITSVAETALTVARRRLSRVGKHECRGLTIGTPRSIAEASDPPDDDQRYDVGIIDEASLMPLDVALTVLVRCNRIILIGDSRQMRPEHGAESILDAGKRSGLLTRSLTYHYRSRHPSLITLSNILSYNMALRTVPRPEVESDYGLSMEWLPNATTDTVGDGRQNRSEAASITRFIEKHIKSRNRATIAVVAMTRQQTKLIRRSLEQCYEECQKSAFYEEHWREEPLIVRSSSEIQGEERDIVLISGTFAPRRSDQHQRFGILEKTGVMDRLNVLLSRSREHMRLFCSYEPADLKLPMGQGAIVLNALVRGFETLTETDLRQETPAYVNSVGRGLGLEVDHLGVVYGFRTRAEKRYRFGLVVSGSDERQEDVEALKAQLEGFGWTIIVAERHVLQRNPGDLVLMLKTVNDHTSA